MTLDPSSPVPMISTLLPSYSWTKTLNFKWLMI
uniref:Uncharacterized protein n=1 Tax=Arundo donax TaxID=35708 RepID=A0A0A9GG87_ARUDO